MDACEIYEAGSGPWCITHDCPVPEDADDCPYPRIAELEAQLAEARAALKTIAAVAGGKDDEHRMFTWIADCADKALLGEE
jgi:hypothetical protein